jgi:hypothetical protein
MERWLFILGRAFPYWSIPTLLAFFQFGVFFRRRNEKPQYFCWFMVAALLYMTLYWFIARGDIHSDQWIREWLAD